MPNGLHWTGRIIRLLQNLIMLLFLVTLFCTGFRLLPHPDLSDGVLLSTAYYDREGKLLRLTLTDDQRYRLWTPLEKISPLVTEGLIRHEDRWFYYHPGFNPYSLIRGFQVSYLRGGHPQGGSTLTMQLARMYWKLNTRTLKGKAIQILRAIQLELSYSKHDILEAYLNYAPYGRNIESIGAASLIYFNKQPDALNLPEALTLSVLPQSPSYRSDSRTGTAGPILLRARNLLFYRWLDLYPEDKRYSALFQLPVTLRQPEQMPFIAPHFIEQLQRQKRLSSNTNHRVVTTLDVRLQKLIERQVNAWVTHEHNRGIHNAAVLLIDTRDMGIRALVGSADYYNRHIQGQVNGTTAKRSPGSTLKPFIYALGAEQGLLHPLTILKDVPANFGPWEPENFDRRFRGPLSATDALNLSRNIPAVKIASQLQNPNLYNFLQLSGVANMASEKHYGLSLVLGGGEVTAQELGRLYSMLANRGEMNPLRMTEDAPRSDPVRLLSQEASFITLNMLGQHRRPGEIASQKIQQPPVYWKTGTSWGFRDAWSCGIFGPYVLIVWLGNFDGKGNNAFVGIDAAAPLFFNIIDSITAEEPHLTEPVHPFPENLRQTEVCLASGHLATPWCRRKGKTWFIPGKSSIRVDTLYRPVAFDKTTGNVVCPPYDPAKVNIEVFEFWPSDLARVFAQAGLPRRQPPSEAHCKNTGMINSGSGAPPLITSPRRNTTYTLRRINNTLSPLILNATADSSRTVIYWFADNIYLGNSTTHSSLEWSPKSSGHYHIRAIDDKGRADTRSVIVDILQDDKSVTTPEKE